MDYDTLDRLNVRQSRAGASRPSVACGRADFEGIVRTHGSMVYRLALVQTRNRADAEDVFQDVFVALVRRMARGGRGFESAEHVRAWLLRATVDRGRDLARAVRRQCTQSLDEFPVELAEGYFRCAPDQERRIIEHEEAQVLWHAVGELPTKLRAAVHLFYVEGLSCEETARALGVTVSTVTTRLARARKQLERSLKGRLS